MPTPRDYFAKGWPGENAVVDQYPLHSTAGEVAMFSFVELVAEGGVTVARQAANAATKVYVAVDNYDATDVMSCGLLPVWLNSANKVIVTPHVDISGLSVGDVLEVKAAGVLQKRTDKTAVGVVDALMADGDVRVRLY